jgi:hypothetical protein
VKKTHPYFSLIIQQLKLGKEIRRGGDNNLPAIDIGKLKVWFQNNCLLKDGSFTIEIKQ